MVGKTPLLHFLHDTAVECCKKGRRKCMVCANKDTQMNQLYICFVKEDFPES